MSELDERFWDKVTVDSQDACWEWNAGKSADGYGVFTLNGKNIRAHRYCWILFNGEIPEGVLICHTCDNPGCVNLDHLWLGTDADNMKDMSEKGRGVSGKAKLSKDDVENIRANRMNLTIIELAEIFEVNQSTISRVINQKIWKGI